MRTRAGRLLTPLEQALIEALRERFLASGLSRRSTGKLVGCSGENVKQMLTGCYSPSLRNIYRLVEALGCELTIKASAGKYEIRLATYNENGEQKTLTVSRGEFLPHSPKETEEDGGETA
jgi:transcriptional regulator with XRE-family HTH domain